MGGIKVLIRKRTVKYVVTNYCSTLKSYAEALMFSGDPGEIILATALECNQVQFCLACHLFFQKNLPAASPPPE